MLADRTARMLAAIDSIEVQVSETCASLRAEAETLLAALETGRTRAPSRSLGGDEAWMDEPDDSLSELLFGD